MYRTAQNWFETRQAAHIASFRFYSFNKRKQIGESLNNHVQIRSKRFAREKFQTQSYWKTHVRSGKSIIHFFGCPKTEDDPLIHDWINDQELGTLIVFSPPRHIIPSLVFLCIRSLCKCISTYSIHKYMFWLWPVLKSRQAIDKFINVTGVFNCLVQTLWSS